MMNEDLSWSGKCESAEYQQKLFNFDDISIFLKIMFIDLIF